MSADPFAPLEQPRKRSAKPPERYRKEYTGEEPFATRTTTKRLQTPFGRERFILFLTLLFLLVLFGRAFELQLVRGQTFRDLAEGHRLKLEVVKAARGVITDRNGEIIAENVPNFRLTVNPRNLPRDPSERAEVLDRLGAWSGLSVAELGQRLRAYQSAEPLVLRDDVSPEEALPMTVESENLAGVNIAVEPRRQYRDAEAFSHLLGYVGARTEPDPTIPAVANDVAGKTGIEASYDERLRGVHGLREIERDAHGKELELVASREAVPGQNLTLAVDAAIQQRGFEALDRMVRARRSTGGALIALDPRNGEVLALASVPGFDLNGFARGLDPSSFQSIVNDTRRPLFNRAIAGEYPSGSTIKPVIASAALQEGIITSRTTVVSTGGIQIDKWFFPDWKPGGHGVTDVRKGIAESVNTFFYLLAGGDANHEGLGVDRIRAYAERFGLNRRLEIDLPGEETGFLPTKEWKEQAKGEPWYIGDTYHLGIGQGDLLVTPLQVATYTAAVANGGTVYRPHLLKEVRDATGETLSAVEPAILDRGFIHPEYLEVVRAGLRDAVTAGSGRALSDFSVAVAGKTGTAEYGSEGKTHSWFTAFAPFDRPEIVVTVLVEGGGEGHESALPVAKEILQTWFDERQRSPSLASAPVDNFTP